jgi:hypothetical protein
MVSINLGNQWLKLKLELKMGPPILPSNWTLPFPGRQIKHWNILLSVAGASWQVAAVSPISVHHRHEHHVHHLPLRATLPHAITISSRQSWYSCSRCSDSYLYCRSLCSFPCVAASSSCSSSYQNRTHHHHPHHSQKLGTSEGSAAAVWITHSSLISPPPHSNSLNWTVCHCWSLH